MARTCEDTFVLGPHRTKKCAQRLDQAAVRCLSEPHPIPKRASTHISLSVNTPSARCDGIQLGECSTNGRSRGIDESAWRARVAWGA